MSVQFGDWRLEVTADRTVRAYTGDRYDEICGEWAYVEVCADGSASLYSGDRYDCGSVPLPVVQAMLDAYTATVKDAELPLQAARNMSAAVAAQRLVMHRMDALPFEPTFVSKDELCPHCGKVL
jgi:hypothetical protein